MLRIGLIAAPAALAALLATSSAAPASRSTHLPRPAAVEREPRPSLDDEVQPAWTEEEIAERIEEVFLEEDREDVEVIRSKHYIVLTNSAVGKKFGKILDEDVYEGFKKLFDFEKPKTMGLMPVYLFKDSDGYVEFQVRVLKVSEAQARASGGIAFRDFYATYYKSPRDPVHFHECAHQIMGNILGLHGGGSWYQEGVAEYYEDIIAKVNRKAEARMLIRTEQHIPFERFVTMGTLLHDAGENLKGGGGAGGAYGQAASVILFLKEGPQKKKFDDFFQKMGKVRRGDREAIEGVLKEVYGWTIADFEQAWKKHFAG